MEKNITKARVMLVHTRSLIIIIKEQGKTHTLAELAVDLATDHVEHVGRASHIDNLHVAVLVLAVQLVLGWVRPGFLVAKLQPPLHSSRRVLRTLTIITVGQREDKTGTLQPLGFTSSDELVNDTLCVVGKVTKLSLPHDKSVGRGQRVTVFETKAVKKGLVSQFKNRVKRR